MIEITDVSKRYAQTLVVDGVTLKIPAGGLTSVVGPNGAGKSTLLGMISRLTPMSAGRIRVGGLDVNVTNTAELAKHLSILRQDNQLQLRLTVKDIVAFGRYPHSRGRLTAHDEQHIEQALGYLNLEDLAERYLDELSGGQRQRAFVAMVLCQDTEYVLLDEPLNSLDMKNAVDMMKVLRRAVDELDKTVVVVLHDINFASCYSDYIVGMRQGKVLCEGPPDKLITPPTLKALYDLDVAVHEIDGQRICIHYG